LAGNIFRRKAIFWDKGAAGWGRLPERWCDVLAIATCGRRLLRASAVLLCLVLSAGVARGEGTTEAGVFCETLKQRADTIRNEWAMSELTLFGCLWPSATKVSDSPLTYKASGTIWLTGTTPKGESVKARREVRGVMTQAPGGDQWNVDHLEYGSMEDLGFFTQLFAWTAWVVALSVVVGLVAAFVGMFLPRGLVGFLSSVIMIGLVWNFGVACFGSNWAAAFCTLVYLFLAGGAAKAVAEA
jgi:hypothetical protein